MKTLLKTLTPIGTALLAGLLALPLTGSAVTLVADYSSDGPSEGFNDATYGANRQAAFEYALGIWSDRLEGPNNVTITVQAEFNPLGGGGILGYAGAEDYFSGIPGGQASTIYGSALAEALAGSDLNGSDPEIYIVFNSDIDAGAIAGIAGWYYGTNGNPPSNRMDLVTVCLHEIGHGLNFLDLINQNTGAFGFGNPGIYDRKLSEFNGTDTYTPLTSLTNAGRYNAIRGNLYWGVPDTDSSGSPDLGPSVVSYYGIPAPMYAPSSFESGSSVSHWDLGAYSPAELMEPALVNGLAIHDVGYAMEAFEDMGWVQGIDASPHVSFPRNSAAQNADIYENSSEGPTTVQVPVLLGSPSASPVSVPYTIFNAIGTPVQGVDYTITPASPLVIPAGQRVGYIEVEVLPDADVAEGNERIVIQLDPPTGGTLISTGGANTFGVMFNNDATSEVENWSLY